QRVFHGSIAPVLRSGGTILDVGCGAGDLARCLARWSRDAGTEVRVTAIDPDPRAIGHATVSEDSRQAATSPPAHATSKGTVTASSAHAIDFRQTTAEHLAATGERFDVVVSNHLLHHLSDVELIEFLEISAALARSLVVHSDMSRHPVAYG